MGDYWFTGEFQIELGGRVKLASSKERREQKVKESAAIGGEVKYCGVED